MAYTHALSTNNYGPAKIVVATSAANGTHTTLAAAMADAVSGDTIILRDSVTENVTLTPGVNIGALPGAELAVSIIGKLTMTGAGTCTISGIKLQTNSDNLISITGSNACILNLISCYLNCTNTTGINIANTSAVVSCYQCQGDLATTGIGLYTTTGVLAFYDSYFTNTGNSSTTSLTSGTGSSTAFTNSIIQSPVSTSTNASFISARNTTFATSSTNTTSITLAGTGGSNFYKCEMLSGSASALSIGSGTSASCVLCQVNSSNTNAITGSGTIMFTPIQFYGTSSKVNVTTQTPSSFGPTNINIQQPAFLVTLTASTTNSTGDGTVYTVPWDSAVYDQVSNFNTGTGTFTAPVTGKYMFNIMVLIQNLLITHTAATMILVTTSKSYQMTFVSPGKVFDANQNCSLTGGVLADMSGGDTATVTITVGGSTKTVGVGAAGTAPVFSSWSGVLVC